MEEKEVKTPSDDLNREHSKASCDRPVLSDGLTIIAARPVLTPSSAHDEQQDDLIIEVDLFKSLDDCNVVDR